jgi:hypothetical protein
MWAVIVSAACVCLAASADQAQVVGLEEAEHAAFLLQPGNELRFYCAPCDDVGWRSEIVGVVETRPVEGEEGMAEILVNGRAIDLAYTFAYRGGDWLNVARFAGIEVSDTPETLDCSSVSSEAGFSATHFRGQIGEGNRVLGQFSLAGDRISGVYAYNRHQQRIGVWGTVNPETGEALLREHSDGKVTGEWRGKLSRAPLTLEGEWAAPSGEPPLPFKLSAFAVPAQAALNTRAGEMELKASRHYPVFLTSGHPHAAALNAQLREALAAEEREIHEQFEAAVAEGTRTVEGEFPSFMQSWEHGLEAYDFAHVSDRVLSMSYVVYEYTGGAHPNSDYPAINWILVDGKLRNASLTDFIQPSDTAMEAVSAMLLDDLKRQGASFVINGTISEFTAKELESFTVSEQGLTFFFPPYAVGPYAEGMYKVQLSWKALGAHGQRALIE